ncbi:peroxisomal biogenesis factor 11-domain-containing protein [Cokeromyces recurvatus]|uniref:peroxisomal biogenesis factor 11-domain-containing protein n=1 Tax=Cokeromyces recurvatus TaxID=90255 RepID=UPI00221F8BE0|nr:peroxisomal biogenesis factor 11-domain-containing protein [Cokeromyces recurvatus]KAI7904252.1 peroxisomal biogenesis factor 11-domain-containing protein [Cokeromyces recurvatus]
MTPNNIPSTFAFPTPSPSPPPELDSRYQQHIKSIHVTTQPKKINKWLNVIQKFLKELDGRDKLMKTIQYFIKILLHYKMARAKHWSSLTSHLSMTRKLIRLGTAMDSIRELSPLKHSLFETIVNLNAIINSISDDIFCFYKLGILGSYLGNQSEKISAYCWFASILIDIRENVLSLNRLQNKKIVKDESELRQKIFITEVSIIKLLMDAVFCACDIWRPIYSSSLQAWSGFFSGLLAGYKLSIKYSI